MIETDGAGVCPQFIPIQENQSDGKLQLHGQRNSQRTTGAGFDGRQKSVD